MDRSDRPTEFRGAIVARGSRRAVLLVLGGVALVACVGVAAGLAGEGNAPHGSPIPTAGAAVAPVSPTAPHTEPPLTAPGFAPVSAPAESADLVPTGGLVADAGGDAFVRPLVADANGTVWVGGYGAISNVDPGTARGRQWTIADDAAFATASVAAARRGGVWLVGPDAIRLFDGERFRVVVRTPGRLLDLAEAPDGSLWARTERYGLVRWVDGTWSDGPPGRPPRGVASIVIDAEGRVWTSDFDMSADGSWHGRGISAWDGQRWTRYGPEDLPAFVGGNPPALIAPPEGGVWATLGRARARFEGGRWIEPDGPRARGRGFLGAVDADGRLWFVYECTLSCGVTLQLYDGSDWTMYGPNEGLPGPGEVDAVWANVLPGPDYTLASTEAGLYRLDDGRWQRIEEPGRAAAATRSARLSSPVQAFAAVSRTEVWASTYFVGAIPGGAGGAGLHRFDGVAWHREQLPVDAVVRDLVAAPDGSLWAATDSGPLVRRGGAWVNHGDAVASAAAMPGEALTGCDAAIAVAPDGGVSYVGQRSGYQVVTLAPGSRSWTLDARADGPVATACPATLAPTADGSIWVLHRGERALGWGKLEHAAGGPWGTVRLDPVDRPGAPVEPKAVVAGRDGTAWVATATRDLIAPASTPEVLQLVNGQWLSRGGGLGPDLVEDLDLLPDGSPVAALGGGVARFDGERWHRALHGVSLEHVSVAPDGSVWVVGSSLYRVPVAMLEP